MKVRALVFGLISIITSNASLAHALPGPELEVSCIAGFQERTAIISLFRDNENLSHYHTGNTPDRSFVDIIQQPEVRAGVMVEVQRVGGAYKLLSFYTRVENPSETNTQAYGGSNFELANFNLILGQSVNAEVVRDPFLGSDSAFGSCTITLRDSLQAKSLQ